MKTLIIVGLILLLATPVFAQAEATHNLEIKLSGEWEMRTTTIIPAASWEMSLDGIGEVYILSQLQIVLREEPAATWWDLF